VNYTKAIAGLIRSPLVRDNNIELGGPNFIESTDIVKSRNVFSTNILEDKSITHLLFVDSDIGFRPEAVVRMVAFDASFVGCICPARAFDPQRIHAAARDIADPAVALEVGYNYIASESFLRESTPSGQMALRIKAGFVKTSRIGMGLTLIRRDVFEIMANRRPDLFGPAKGWDSKSKLNGRVFQCFDLERDDEGGYIGEDYSFCNRWINDCGGEIWVSMDESISHMGPTMYEGSFNKRLQYEIWLAQRSAASTEKPD
jgi:hypothetical protein